MNRATGQQATRRSVALDRLESITTGAAIAGVAGTIGFGALAAISFSGTTNARDGQSGSDFQSDGTGPGDDNVTVPVAPNTNDDNGSQPFQAAPPPQTSSRRGHATTGGSG
jgi:hypothetical protein